MQPPAHRPSNVPSGGPRIENPLLAFEEETQEPTPPRKDVRWVRVEVPPTPLKTSTSRVQRRYVIVATAVALVVALLAIGAAISRVQRSATTNDAVTPADTRLASLTVVSRPDGAQVVVDDRVHGVTPLTIQIAPGKHTLKVRAGETERSMTLDALPGGDILRDLDLAPAATPAARPRSASADSATLKAASVAAGPGWLTISAPFEVQAIEHGEVIGTSAARRIMLLSGRHSLAIVNRLYEFEEQRTVEISPGQTATITVEVPAVSVNIGAWPWADVTVDGTALGRTPLPNVTLAVGSHRFVFRHPELGERQQDVVLTSRHIQRVFADLTR